MTAPKRYPASVLAHGGIDGLAREAMRLVRKMDAAAACVDRAGIGATLRTAGLADHVETLRAEGRTHELAGLVTRLSDVVVAAAERCDPNGRAALVLRTSEEQWGRYRDYEHYVSWRIAA